MKFEAFETINSGTSVKEEVVSEVTRISSGISIKDVILSRVGKDEE